MGGRVQVAGIGPAFNRKRPASRPGAGRFIAGAFCFPRENLCKRALSPRTGAKSGRPQASAAAGHCIPYKSCCSRITSAAPGRPRNPTASAVNGLTATCSPTQAAKGRSPATAPPPPARRRPASRHKKRIGVRRRIAHQPHKPQPNGEREHHFPGDPHAKHLPGASASAPRTGHPMRGRVMLRTRFRRGDRQEVPASTSPIRAGSAA